MYIKKNFPPMMIIFIKRMLNSFVRVETIVPYALSHMKL